MAEFRMPSLGADMEAGTLVEWKVKPGDRVHRGDIIAAVETAKGMIEIEVFEDGVVDQVFIQPGNEVPVGEVLATICSEEELAVPITGVESERVRISPLARKFAAELGVNIRTVKGTGPGGAISRADIERTVQAVQAVAKAPVSEVQAAKPEEKPAFPPVKPAQSIEKPPAETVKPGVAPAVETRRTTADFQFAMRQAIAAAMARSNREIPHYYLETEIDMSRALRWLEAENLKRSIKDRLLPVVLLLKAVALSLVDIPELNGYWIDERHQPSEAIHIGFAIALRQGGLVTPAIHHVDLKSLDELRDAVTDLITRTRAGHLRSSELTDGTITVTSLGDRGVEKVFGVIYPPQVALVGFGKIAERPWIENGMIGIRPVLIATLSGDHRATDGHRGALFLEALNHYLQEAEKL